MRQLQGEGKPSPSFPSRIMNDGKFFRCQFCNKLVTDRMLQKGQCAGHRLKVAGYATFWEWLMVKIGIIR